jgi:hypothetical protein
MERGTVIKKLASWDLKMGDDFFMKMVIFPIVVTKFILCDSKCIYIKKL